jgi:hypothetical protein
MLGLRAMGQGRTLELRPMSRFSRTGFPTAQLPYNFSAGCGQAGGLRVKRKDHGKSSRNQHDAGEQGLPGAALRGRASQEGTACNR